MKFILPIFILLFSIKVYSNTNPDNKPREGFPFYKMHLSIGAGVAHSEKNFILYSGSAFFSSRNNFSFGAGYELYKTDNTDPGKQEKSINIFATYNNHIFPRNKSLAEFYAGGGIGIVANSINPLVILKVNINFSKYVSIGVEGKQSLAFGPDSGLHNYLHGFIGYNIFP